MKDDTGKPRRWYLIFVLLAAFHLIQKGLALFGPVEWLQPTILRTYSFWQLGADFVADSLVSLFSTNAGSAVKFITHVLFDCAVCLLFIQFTKIYSGKFILFVMLLSLPQFTIMPGPDPTLNDGAAVIGVLVALWYVLLIVATIVVFKAERSRSNLFLVLILAGFFSTIVVPFDIPIGAIIGIILIVLFLLGMFRKNRYQAA